MVHVPPDVLFVAEDAALADSIRRAFPIPGVHGVARVHALGGPLVAWPPGPAHPPGVTLKLEEPGLMEASPDRTAALLRAASRAGEIVVVGAPGGATTGLALDVAEALQLIEADRAPAALSWTQPSDCSREGLRRAHDARAAIVPAAAAAFRARRLIERALAAALPPAAGLLGAREISTLAVLAGVSGDPIVATVRLRLPAADRGRDFVAELDVSRAMADDAATMDRLAALSAHPLSPATVARRSVIPDLLPDAAGVMVEAVRLGFPAAEVDRALRSLYAGGHLPWPWPPATHNDEDNALGIGPPGLRLLAEIADGLGLRFDPGLLQAAPPGAPFEALHPLPGAETNVSVDPAVLDVSGAVLALVARRAIAVGIQDRREETAHTAGLPEWARSLVWRRRAGSWHPGSQDEDDPKLRRLTRDEIIVRAMSDHGTAAPEDWGVITDTLVAGGWVDDDARPTPQAVAVLEALPPSLLDPATLTVALRAAEAERPNPGSPAPWRRMAAVALARLPEALRATVAAELASPPGRAPEPRPNPAPARARGTSLAAGLARLRAEGVSEDRDG